MPISHAQFRRTNPVPYKEVYTILDGVTGKGQYVGTYMAFAPHDNGWWGEGEIKFYMDGDTDFPTICGTGTEDYFCGSYDFDVDGKYLEFCTPYAGLSKVVQSDGTYKAQQRFSLCTAGTSQTPSASTQIFALQYRISGGTEAAAI